MNQEGCGVIRSSRPHRVTRGWRLCSRPVVAAAVVLGWAIAGAQSSPDQAALSPTETLRKRDTTLQTLVASTKTPDKSVEVRKSIVESFDFVEHSRLSLGKYWEERTPQERTEFVEVMRQWTENRAVRKLLKRAEQTSYDGEEITESRAVVKTTVRYKGTRTSVDYKMRLVDGHWRIYDMMIDDASVVMANRDAFSKKIRKTSYAELVRTLKKKTLEAS